MTKISQEGLKNQLQEFPSDLFEEFISDVWQEMGWSTSVTPSANDRGIDIVANRSGVYDEKVLIQAKCYSESNKVGRPEIQQYSALKQQEPEVDAVLVVTSSSFTEGAIELAGELNIKTVSGDELAENVLHYLSPARISKYIDLDETQSQESGGASTTRINKNVSWDDLDYYEEQLGEIYENYIINFPMREFPANLRFVPTESGDRFSEYYIVGRAHRLRILDQKLWKQTEKTVREHQWEVLGGEALGTVGGVEVNTRPDDADEYSLGFDPQPVESDPAKPALHGRVSKLILTRVFEVELSGCKVVEEEPISGWKEEYAIH